MKKKQLPVGFDIFEDIIKKDFYIENKKYDEIFAPEFTTKVYKYAIACKDKRCKVKCTDN